MARTLSEINDVIHTQVIDFENLYIPGVILTDINSTKLSEIDRQHTKMKPAAHG